MGITINGYVEPAASLPIGDHVVAIMEAKRVVSQGAAKATQIEVKMQCEEGIQTEWIPIGDKSMFRFQQLIAATAEGQKRPEDIDNATWEGIFYTSFNKLDSDADIDNFAIYLEKRQKPFKLTVRMQADERFPDDRTKDRPRVQVFSPAARPRFASQAEIAAWQPFTGGSGGEGEEEEAEKAPPPPPGI